MSKLDIYRRINGRFYDDQLKSVNPLRRWFHFQRYKIINSFIKSLYTPGMKIVDIGTGSCGWNKDKLPVYGIDCNEQLLLYGKKQGRLIDYKVADIHNTGFADNTFNITVGAEVLEHIEDVDAVVKEVYRILDQDGAFIVSVPDGSKFSVWNILFFVQTFYKGYIRGESYYRKQCGHAQHFSPQSLSDLLRRNGFEIEVEFSTWKCSIFLVAGKGNRLAQPRRSYDDLTVIISVKNGVDNICDVIEGLLQNYPNLNIIVSDDESTDGTVEAIKDAQRHNKNILLLDRKYEKVKGQTVSVLDAIEMVRTKYFIVMDSEGQHEAKYVAKIYNQLKLNSKLSVASRVAVPGWRWDKKFIWRAGSFLGKVILFLRKKKTSLDILSSFFGVETAYWKKVVKGKRDCFSLKRYKVLFDFLKICNSSISIENVYY